MLPVSDKERKALPIWTGFLMYFPDVPAAIAQVSRIGNDQHNPGEPLHWAREKSTDQMNTAIRHMMDHGRGNRFDADGSRHLAKAIWRLCAELQLDIERDEAPQALPAVETPWVPRRANAETEDFCEAYSPKGYFGCEQPKSHPGKHTAWRDFDLNDKYVGDWD